jgi:hypothetical protein
MKEIMMRLGGKDDDALQELNVKSNWMHLHNA